ncbi:hypothetical protein M426DRAFT_118482 [Hypoxylon sp. CI-4A]|nr:hypothetical protein M426DRAFT_118482 [Hypoxylon sp. CI-4A]
METDHQPLEAGAMSQHPHPRKRTQSRASTASIRSASTQPNLDHQAMMVQHNAFQEQWVANERSQSRDMSSAMQQMPAGDMMLRPASQMQAAQHYPPIAPNMHPGVGSAIPYHQHPGLHHAASTETFGGNTSFTDGDSQMLEHEEDEEGESSQLVAPSKSTKTSANNELEMRQLFHTNKHRSLGDVATELHGNERGPNSERARQIFAMLWINGVCSRGKGSVPRGRVYANYASRCATERITVLNPASFGKLVRVLFPGLRTRRLGVRGESKYHYVNFTMIDDEPEIRAPPIQPAIPFPESTPFPQSFSAPQSQSPALNAQNSALPSPTLVQHSDMHTAPRTTSARGYSLYNQPDVNNIDQLDSTSSKTVLPLAFPDEEEQINQATTIILPDIQPFLPGGTDPDAAKSLTALYRSHCTSLVECIRFCKEKTFFHLYTSFQGTLTMPVQKLFSHPGIALWIEECDFMLYQRMMQIISVLLLQVVPRSVLDTFRNISERLVLHIRDSYQGQPRHVVEAKEAPAAIFANLLDRALRVNLTAHAAANMISNSANRDQMYRDWITMVRIRKVAECIPTKGMDDVVKVLLNEIRDLVNPTDVPWDVECLTLYGDVAIRNGRDTQPTEQEEGSAEWVLERWSTFLKSLPRRFPYATPADIVDGVQRVGTEVMRDLTMSQGKSFGAWWVTKCWLDEMVAFLAEYGGLLRTKNISSFAPTVSKHSMSTIDVSKPDSRMGSVSEDFGLSRNSQPQPDRAPFPTQLETSGRDSLNSSVNHDDSGIGIRTPEEESPMEKFDFPQGPGPSLLGLELEPPVQ